MKPFHTLHCSILLIVKYCKGKLNHVIKQSLIFLNYVTLNVTNSKHKSFITYIYITLGLHWVQKVLQKVEIWINKRTRQRKKQEECLCFMKICFKKGKWTLQYFPIIMTILRFGSYSNR